MAAFLKLDDIKGEIVLDTTPPAVAVCFKDAAGFQNDALTPGGTYDGGGGTYDGGGGQYVSSYREDGANRFTTGGGGDSLTDAGLGTNSFHQGADALTNVSPTTVRNGVWDDSTTWSGASDSVISEACTPTCALGFAYDALVQQVNGTIGYEMQAGMGISDNRFVSEAVEALTNFGQSSDPALDAAGGFQPREVAAVEIGRPPDPKLWLQMLG